MSDGTPDILETIAIEPPAVESDVTVHYHSNRSGDRTTRQGTLWEYTTNESGDTLALISHSHNRHITIVHFDAPVVISATHGQQTTLGPLVAMETPDQPLDVDGHVATPPIGGLEVCELGVRFTDEFDESAILTDSELQKHIETTDPGDTFDLENHWGTHIPTTHRDLLRAKHRLELARSVEE